MILNSENIPYAGTTYNYPIQIVKSKLISKKTVKNDNKTIKLVKK